jgi:uncharacterized protein (TIGR02147 family)
MLNGQNSYRAFLKTALARRMEKNPAYSMGALAKATGISRSFLYDVLGGRKNLSAEASARIAQRLGFTPSESEIFSLLVQLETAKDFHFRQGLLQKIQALDPSARVYDLSLDVFQTIADWYHIAILQLAELSGFKLSPRSAARKLGITIAEADAAIDRLLRLGLLEKTRDDSYAKTSSRLLVQAQVPSGAVARFHGQILKRAQDAVHAQPPAERKGRSELIPLNPEILAQAEAILDRAYEEVIALAEKSRTKTSVYALSTQFFNLTSERK